MAIQAQLYSENIGFPSCGGQGLMLDNGYGGSEFVQLYFNLQQQKQQQQQRHNMQQLQNQQRNHTLFSDNSCPVATVSRTANTNCCSNYNTHLPMPNSQIMLTSQNEEFDRYIRLQNERLRILLQAQNKQQLAILLKKIESNIQPLLRQKDQEIARAVKRSMELEGFLKRMEMESQAWQRVAKENEAMVVSLNNTIEQLREQASCCLDNPAEDAESCCDMNEDEKEKPTEDTVCKACNSRNPCVLFLPCRHLCSCKACEPFLDSCPVCQVPKKASIEALI